MSSHPRPARSPRSSRTARVGLFRVVLAAVVSFSAAGIAPSSPDPTPAPQVVTCTFSNPAYSGFCRVTPKMAAGGSAKKACQGVLACLNDTRCIHTYCNATTIRVGWKLESVAAPPAAR